ncbi:unnamed protein product, partial [Rotaria socialis]
APDPGTGTGCTKVDGLVVCASSPSVGSTTGGTTGGTGSGSGNGSNFAGSCSGGFQCSGGDAIQCAIAKEQYTRNCELFDDDANPLAEFYYSERNKEGSQSDKLPGNETVNVGAGNFNTTNALGAAGGAQDLAVV